MANKEAFKALYDKYLRNECTEEELQALVAELGAGPGEFREELVNELLEHTWLETEAPGKFRVPDVELTAAAIAPPGRKYIWMRWAAAACVAVLLGAGIYMWLNNTRQTAPPDAFAQTPQDLPPGGNKAVLTLADGSTVELDSAGNTVVPRQGNTQVTLNGQNGLVYSEAGGSAPEPVFNTLATPRGGQYRLTLPDGSRVWLNAASSIRFPAAFAGTRRDVTVNGEVYFEIQHDARRPFVVTAGTAVVEVLGTHFNVMAYADEGVINTTLVEGAVKVSNGVTSQILKPSQQASVNKANGIVAVQQVNAANAIAWVKGEMPMDGIGLEELMRKISRWYDVDVTIKTPLPKREFQGVLNRNVNLSYVLDALNANGVHAKLDGRRITVSEKQEQ